MALNGTDMAGAVVDALVAAGKFDGLSPAQIAAVKSDMAISYNAMVTYIIANMEIKGVTVSDPAGIVETYTAGVGSNGGLLNAPPYPVTGIVNKPLQTLIQNNDGPGRVL